MAWSQVKIEINGNEMIGQMHSSGHLVTIPYVDSLAASDAVCIDGKPYTVNRAINVGGRCEILDVFVDAEAPKKAKAKKAEAQSDEETLDE